MLATVVWSRKKLVSISIAVVAALAIIGCGGSGDPPTAGSAASPPTDPTLTGEAVEVLERDYKIFSGPFRKSDQMPEELVPASTAERLGLDLDNSRYAKSYRGARLYVVPSRPSTCLFSEITAISFCWNTWTVVRGYATSTALCGEGLDKSKVATFGIVPVGVHKVTIVEGNGSRHTVPVRNNVFVGETSSAPPPPLQIEWKRFGQGVVHPIRDSFKVKRDC